MGAPGDDIRVVVVDDHDLFRRGLRELLEEQGIRVVGEASDGVEGVRLASHALPDVLVMDLNMPRLSGVEATRRLATAAPTVRVLVLTISADEADIAAAFAAGAAAYIVKTTHPDDIASGIRQAFENSVFLPGHGAGVRDVGSRAAKTSARGADAALPEGGLTRREIEILRLVAQGHSNGQLARMLWVTEQTVKFHLSNVYRKLDVANRTEASRWAYAHDVIDPGAGIEATERVRPPGSHSPRPQLQLAAARAQAR